MRFHLCCWRSSRNGIESVGCVLYEVVRNRWMGRKLWVQYNERLVGLSLVRGKLWWMTWYVKVHLDDKINVSGSA